MTSHHLVFDDEVHFILTMDILSIKERGEHACIVSVIHVIYVIYGDHEIRSVICAPMIFSPYTSTHSLPPKKRGRSKTYSKGRGGGGGVRGKGGGAKERVREEEGREGGGKKAGNQSRHHPHITAT